MIPLQAQTPTPSGQAVERFTDALVYADSVALAVGVLCLLIGILFQLSTLDKSSRGYTRELALFALCFLLIGNTAVMNAYPESAMIKAAGYLLASSLLTWRFGRAFERHRKRKSES